MTSKDRFILVQTHKDNSIKTIIGSFNEICEEIEYQLSKKDEDLFKVKNIIVYDRKNSDNDLKLNCYEYVYEEYDKDGALYSQFIDTYYLDEDLE